MSRTPAALVRLQRVAKRYPSGVLALDGVDLELGAREFVCLLGASGCGKSTLLRVLAGLEQPSAGAVVWPNQAAGVPDLGFVFQEPTLMPWASVADNVWLPLRLAGRSRADSAATVAEALERVGLTRFAAAYTRELSGGMKMRASIARALVTRPRLLLLDEPFAALDEITRLRLNDDLLAIQAEQGFAVLFVTHSVYESVYLADRIVVMAPRPGRVVEEIAIDEAAPRSEAFRTSARYNAHCLAVSAALRRTLDAERTAVS